MNARIDQKIIDQKIHRFLARKSPVRTLSEAIVYRFGFVQSKRQRTDITYERI